MVRVLRWYRQLLEAPQIVLTRSAVFFKREVTLVDAAMHVNLIETVGKRRNAKFGHKHNDNRAKHWRDKTNSIELGDFLVSIPHNSSLSFARCPVPSIQVSHEKPLRCPFLLQSSDLDFYAHFCDE